MHRSRLVALLVGFTLLAAACSSDGGSTADTASPDPASSDTASSDTASDSAPPSAGGADTDEAGDDDNTDGDDNEGGDPADAAPVPDPADPAEAAVAAEENLDGLEASDDVRLIEILDVTTGEATTLADAVDGDRPVLLWFWAPH